MIEYMLPVMWREGVGAGVGAGVSWATATSWASSAGAGVGMRVSWARLLLGRLGERGCGHDLVGPGQLGRLSWLGWFGSSFLPLFYFLISISNSISPFEVFYMYTALVGST